MTNPRDEDAPPVDLLAAVFGAAFIGSVLVVACRVIGARERASAASRPPPPRTFASEFPGLARRMTGRPGWAEANHEN